MNYFFVGVLVIAAVLVDAYFLMLGVGIAHLDWWSLIPAMSYGSAFVLTSALAAFVGLPMAALVLAKEALL